jgi:TonB family protein
MQQECGALLKDSQFSFKRRTRPLLLSFAAHWVALLFLLHSPEPIFVQPASVAFGEGGSATKITYLAPRLAADAGTTRRPARPLMFRKKSTAPAVSALEAPISPRQQRPETSVPAEKNQASAQALLAGSPFGSLLEGPVIGHEVRPALPVTGVHPMISKLDMPSGVNEGNVIVEIIIDRQGNIVEKKIVQGLGDGLDDMALTALNQWHFTPATLDGIAMASKQLVSFHFPSS